MNRLMTRTCAVAELATAVNVYGDYEPTSVYESNATTVCWAEPKTSGEDSRYGTVASSDWLVVLPADVTVTARSRVVLDGGPTLEVIGHPRPMWSPRGAHHVELDARVVE